MQAHDGLANVSTAIADALIRAGQDLAWNVSLVNADFPLLEVLVNKTKKASQVAVAESTFRELCRRCVCSGSSVAARCAVAVAVSVWGCAAAECRLRILLFDLVYNRGSNEQHICVLAVEALRAELACREGTLFSRCHSHLERSVLELAIMCTLRDLTREVNIASRETASSRTIYGEAAAVASRLSASLDLESCDDEKLDQSLRATLALRSLTSEVTFSLRLALRLESRRRKGVSAYKDILVGMIWPTVSSSVVDYDHAVGTVCLRKGDNGLPFMSNAVLAAGAVLASMDWGEKSSDVRHGCIEVKNRLCGMLECEELPSKMRASVGRALTWVVLEGASGGKQSNQLCGRLTSEDCRMVSRVSAFLQRLDVKLGGAERLEQKSFAAVRKASQM